MFDKDKLAEVFGGLLRVCGRYPESLGAFPSQARVVLDCLIAIFPWLSRFHIRRGGNELRWRAWDDKVGDSAIVFTTVEEAGEQVRRWIVEHVERERTD